MGMGHVGCCFYLADGYLSQYLGGIECLVCLSCSPSLSLLLLLFWSSGQFMSLTMYTRQRVLHIPLWYLCTPKHEISIDIFTLLLLIHTTHLLTHRSVSRSASQRIISLACCKHTLSPAREPRELRRVGFAKLGEHSWGSVSFGAHSVLPDTRHMPI